MPMCLLVSHRHCKHVHSTRFVPTVIQQEVHEVDENHEKDAVVRPLPPWPAGHFACSNNPGEVTGVFCQTAPVLSQALSTV